MVRAPQKNRAEIGHDSNRLKEKGGELFPNNKIAQKNGGSNPTTVPKPKNCIIKSAQAAPQKPSRFVTCPSLAVLREGSAIFQLAKDRAAKITISSKAKAIHVDN